MGVQQGVALVRGTDGPVQHRRTSQPLIKRENEGSAIFDIVCVCRFVGNELTAKGDLLELANAATGFGYSWPEFIEIGERAVNLARAFGAREGFGRKDDRLPVRFNTVPLPSGLAKGNVARVDEMLGPYYELCGWDEDGRPTPDKLRSLGLDFVVDILYGEGGAREEARAARGRVRRSRSLHSTEATRTEV